MSGTVRDPLHKWWPSRGHAALRCVGSLATVVILSAVLSSCFNSDKAGQLFGAPGDGGGSPGLGNEYEQGTGGGFVLRDLFIGARLGANGPSVLRTFPADGAENVTLRSHLLVVFSESITEQSANGGIRVFPAGTTTPVQGTIDLFDGQTVALFTPTDQLLADTRYEIVVNASVSDLQGKPLEIEGGSGATELGVSFETGPSTGDPPFEVTASFPVGNASNVVRTADAGVFFSEAVNSTLSSGGLFAPGNVVVNSNGKQLGFGVDYSLTGVGGALVRGFLVELSADLPAGVDVEIEVSSLLESADNEHQLGNGFRLKFEAQDLSTPSQISFPDQSEIAGADGFISVTNLDALLTEVALTSDGQDPDDITVFFFDSETENALIFLEGDPARPARFTADLMPEETEALPDGNVIVAAFSRRRTFRSSISVIGSMRKDTVGPFLEGLGPPLVTLGVEPFSVDVFYTFVRETVMYGTMNEPCSGVSFEFDGLNNLDFNSTQFAPGLSTGVGNFFMTAPSSDGPFLHSSSPRSSVVVIAADQFGNGSAGFDTVNVGTIGAVGVANPDAAEGTAMTITTYAGDDLHALGGDLSDVGMVVLDEFPPSASGANRIVKGMGESASLVAFSDADFAAIPTTLVTLSIAANGYQPICIAGLEKPQSSAPVAAVPVLVPLVAGSRVNFDPDFVDAGAGSRVLVGSSESDMDEDTLEEERLIDATSPLSLTGDQLSVVSAVEEDPAGSGSYRFAASLPFGLEVGTGGAGGTPSRKIDFSDRPVYNSATPNVTGTTTFTDADVSGDPFTPGLAGPLGLLGGESDQYRRLRLVCKLPGLMQPVGIARADGASFTGFGTGDADRTGSVFLPAGFLTNDSVDDTGVEDSAIELILQPSLIDPSQDVDAAVFDDRVLLEMHVEDTVNPGDASVSRAFTRQRLRRSESSTASFQAVPKINVLDATHPPAIDWPEVTGGSNAVHRLQLVSVGGATWNLYVLAQPGGGTLSFQFPAVPDDFVDDNPFGGAGTVAFDFASAGDYLTSVESYDFDPASGSATFQFDLDAFFQSDLALEHFFLSRSDPGFQMTTD